MLCGRQGIGEEKEMAEAAKCFGVERLFTVAGNVHVAYFDYLIVPLSSRLQWSGHSLNMK